MFRLLLSNDIKFLENITQGFKRIISWNKYRSEITTRSNHNDLGYLIDPTLRNFNRLFALSFRNGKNDPTRTSFDKYYMLLVEIKNFNPLIHNKLFCVHPTIKKKNKKQETYGKLIEIIGNDDYTTGTLLDYLFHQNYY